MGFLGLIIPLAMKLLEMWLNNKADKAKAYKEFLAFIDKMHPTAPAELSQSYDAQRNRIKAELEKLDAAQ